MSGLKARHSVWKELHARKRGVRSLTLLTFAAAVQEAITTVTMALFAKRPTWDLLDVCYDVSSNYRGPQQSCPQSLCNRGPDKAYLTILPRPGCTSWSFLIFSRNEVTSFKHQIRLLPCWCTRWIFDNSIHCYFAARVFETFYQCMWWCPDRIWQNPVWFAISRFWCTYAIFPCLCTISLQVSSLEQACVHSKFF